MKQFYSLPYGRTTLDFEFPSDCEVDVFEPVHTPGAADPRLEVQLALDRFAADGAPGGFGSTSRVAIAINDKTRPVPHQHILPPLLERLASLGIVPENIRFLVATGTHTPLPPDEFERVLPAEILARYPAASHDCDDQENLVHLGITSRGTPVAINRTFMEADLRIVVGTLEPHHFMGFSGGAKTAGIGLAGRETINRNHTLLMHPNARIGAYEDNPIRMDLEEIGSLIGIHLAVNVILNDRREIVHALAGSPLAVMEAGVPVARSISLTPVPHAYDLVIASAGGHPKDINLYQAQKAITPASLLTRDNGVILLVAACPEGSGSAGFEAFMQDVHTPQGVLEKFKHEGFRIGPHKAFQIARDAQRVHLIALTELPADKVQRLLLSPASSPQAALAQAFQRLPDNPQIAILPKAAQTIPILMVHQ
ncbi:MAG TPA: nickel-dependent lactate racemase [Anaerolineaceae bacterium]|nr:nickel-dependent lactate racemase [Anaerolineaceae bacterium]